MVQKIKHDWLYLVLLYCGLLLLRFINGIFINPHAERALSNAYCTNVMEFFKNQYFENRRNKIQISVL
jgi:hypothetical protein